MVEYASRAAVESQASAEFPKAMELLEEIDLLSTDIAGRNQDKDDVIDHLDYHYLIGYVNGLVDKDPTGGHNLNALGVVEKIRSKTNVEDPLAESFIQYVQKRLDAALDKIRTHRVQFDATKDPVSLDALQLPTFVTQLLRFEKAVNIAKDTGVTDLSAFKEDYRALKIHPVGFFLPEAQVELGKIAAKYPEVLDDKAPFQDQAKLKEGENTELGTLLIDIFTEIADADKANKIWAELKVWFEDNDDALVNLLKLTQAFEGNKPGNMDVPEGLPELQTALRTVLEKKANLLKKKQISRTIDENAPLTDYNLKEDRIKELLEVIDLIVHPEKTPQFISWKKDVIQAFKVFPTAGPVFTYEAFLDKTKRSLDAKTKLDNATEAPALRRIRDFLEAEESIIVLNVYDVQPGSNFNKTLIQEKKEYLDAEITRVTELIDKDNHLKGTVVASEEHKGNEVVKLELVHLMFDVLRKKNPDMPRFTEIKDFCEREGVAKFMEHLLVAIGNYTVDEIFNVTASSGSTDIPLPKSDANLWGMNFDVTSRDITGEPTLEKFFKDFPWKDIMPGVSQTTIDGEWLNLWKYRILHIQMMHNYAKDMADLSGDFQKMEIIEQVQKLLGSEKTEGGGYFHWDLPPFYQRMHSDDPAAGKASQELHKVFASTEGEEQYWRVPEMVNYFTSAVERELPDLVFLSRSDKKTELSRLHDKLVKKIPEGIRLKKADGSYSDENLVQIAWDVAMWTMLVTLRIFDYDDDGLDSKLAWFINSGEYWTKVPHGRSNTGYEWRDTGAEVNRIIPTRADFIHFYVDLAPERYVKYNLEDVIEEKKRTAERAETLPKESEERMDLERRAAQMSKFIIETRQVGVGEYQDLASLHTLDDIEQRLHSMPKPGEAGTTPVDVEEFNRLTAFLEYCRTKLADLRTKRLSDFGPLPAGTRDRLLDEDEVFKKLRLYAQNIAVDDRYKIIRIKPEYSAMRSPNPAEWPDISEMTFIRIPVPYFEYSQRKAGRNLKRADFIAMSDRQIMDSMIDPKFVRYGSITPTHARMWAGVVGDGKKWMDFLAARNPKAVYTPIHESHMAKHDIHKETHLSEFVRDIQDKVRDANAYIIAGLGGLTDRVDISSQAAALDKALRADVVITHLSIDDLVKKQSDGGMGFSEITQGTRYFCEKMNTGAGPVYKDGDGIEDAQPVTEMWLQTYRKPYRGKHVVKHGKKDRVVTETISQLRRRVTDSKELRKAKASIVPEGIRLAADIALSVDSKGASMHQAAQNQFVVEAFIVSMGLYLDQYRYKSVEGDEKIPFDPGLLETVRGEIKTISGADPLDFAHRELLLQMCDMMFESFLGPDFGGENFDAGLSKKIVRRYSRELIENMMKDRGLIGTREQYVVDTHYYKGAWSKIGEVTSKDDDKKGKH